MAGQYDVLSRYEPVKLAEARIKCPACGRETLRITDYLYEIPHVGKVVLTTGKCDYCGYKFTDVRLAEAREPSRIVVPIEGKDDINALVVRASTATIRIPELGLEMKPGPAAEGFITTVEGVLARFLDALKIACSDPSADRKACEEKEREIREAMEGKRRFTLIVEDPEGVSTVVSAKARIEPLREQPQ